LKHDIFLQKSYCKLDAISQNRTANLQNITVRILFLKAPSLLHFLCYDV